MKVLLIGDSPESTGATLLRLQEKGITRVLPVAGLQTAIERLELQPETLGLVICDYRGGSLALLKCLLEVTARTPCVVLVDASTQSLDVSAVKREALVEVVNRDDQKAFDEMIDRLGADGVFSDSEASDDDFIQITTKTLVLRRPLKADVYLRLAPGRYCKRFRAADGFDAADLDRAVLNKGIDHLYIRKDQAQALIEAKGQDYEQVVTDPNASDKAAREAASESLEIVHDLVTKLGFTQAVQDLTRKTVALTMKAMGASPQLTSVLGRLRVNEGKYLSSHSIMSAEVACAIAHRIGWGTASTFMKLTLAGLLHDLALTDNRLARMRHLGDVHESNGFSEADFIAFKAHPGRAAEYARHFHEIPGGVDLIVEQHHERSQGNGFPRGLGYTQIAPLACVFIVAHELLEYFLDRVPTNDRANMIELFLVEKSALYSDGMFGKIFSSMKTGLPLSQ